MKKKKNAFTLIELLAIIVILAIIAVITVPIILNIIENSRKGAATDSAYGFKDAVNKYYVTELSKPENQNLILNGKYDVSTGGVLDGSGISNKEIPVSGDKPSAGELHYTNNTLQGGCLVIGDYQVIFDGGSVSSTTKGNCSSYDFNNSGEQGGSQNENEGDETPQQAVTPLEIGTDVDYSTTLNNTTLDDWKVFLSNENYTYLIYGDYLPNSAVSISGIGKQSEYAVYADENRTILLNALTTTSNWSDLITNGKINNVSINQSVTDDVWAMGAPTVDLWVNSWNAKYPRDTLDSTITSINLSNKTGYDNTLYFPHQEEIDNGNSYGYWLASPYAESDSDVMNVRHDGYVSYENYGYDSAYCAFRPIIKLPTSVVNP